MPEEVEGRIARLEDHGRDALDLVRHALAQEVHARQIARGCVRARSHMAGEVEQEQAVPAGDSVLRLGVGVGGVRVHRDDRPRVGQTLLQHLAPGELGQLALGGRLAFAEPAGRLLRGRLLRLRQQLGGDGLGGQLLRAEHAADLRHQIGAGDHLGAHRADQLDRARVHAGHGGDLVPGRVLHGHPARPAQDAPQFAVAQPPGRIGGGKARHSVQSVRLDGVDQLLRLPTRGHQAIPPAAADAARVEAQHAVGDRVGAAEVVEEPAVQLLLLQRRLNPGEPFGREARRFGRGGGRGRRCGRGGLRHDRGNQEKDHFSYPPAPAKPSSRSRNSTLKVVSEP